ncbi:restriction endonuclease subunit S [Lysinibacillus sp. FSL K6-0232]|uniref:restriction endonuclease subunit S n=1 Tax=Lysinibacillus sp. FSL K6-0232 TaxID=2921425 RepID=UPI0030FA4896
MGEVREGYKMTELGVVPSEWEVLTVDDIANKIVGGGTPSRENESFYNGDIPWVTVKDMKGSFYQEDAQEFITEAALKNSASNLIEPNNIIVATRIALGRGFINTKEVAINQDLKAIYLNDTKVKNEYFLYWYLQNAEFIKGLGSGSTVKGIRVEQLKSLQLPIPNIGEQQKIASILSTVDEQVDETEQLIVKTKELKKGLMQQLLTKGIGHTEFKQTELGEIPNEWEIKDLIDIGTFSKGKGIAKKDLSDKGMPCILYGQLYTKYKERIDKVTSYTEIEVKNPVIGMKNDLLIPSSGETAIDIATASALNVDNIYIGGDINLFTPFIEVDSNFLSLQINSTRKSELAKLAQGSSVYHLYSSSLENFSVVLPSLEEQQKIAQILSTVDEQIDIYEQEKVKYEELKKGLMQQLLTGQIRVKI